MSYGAWLKQQRTKRDLSQEALAELVGVDSTYVNKIENGRVKRAELLWMEGLRSLDWFREHEASVQAEQQELRDALEALPSTPDPKELRQIAKAITGISGHIDELPPDAVAALVRRLGVVQHGPSGVKMVYNSLAALLVPEPCVLPNRGRNDPRPSRSF